jgi:hypothetical protein
MPADLKTWKTTRGSCAVAISMAVFTVFALDVVSLSHEELSMKVL